MFYRGGLLLGIYLEEWLLGGNCDSSRLLQKKASLAKEVAPLVATKKEEFEGESANVDSCEAKPWETPYMPDVDSKHSNATT